MSLAASNGTLAAHIHVEGFDHFHSDAFNRRQVTAAMRKAGRLVANRARINLSLAGGGSNYPRIRSGELRNSINMKVTRIGLLVKIMPRKTSGMKDFYPAYLHYGVRRGSRLKALAPGEGVGKSNRRRAGARAAELAARRASPWRIEPRENYIADALEDEADRVRQVLSAGFAAALK